MDKHRRREDLANAVIVRFTMHGAQKKKRRDINTNLLL